MKNKKLLRIIFQGGALLLIVGIAFYLAHFARGSEAIQEAVSSYGYTGIFVISLISGFNLVSSHGLLFSCSDCLDYFKSEIIVWLADIVAGTLAYPFANIISAYLENTLPNILLLLVNQF